MKTKIQVMVEIELDSPVQEAVVRGQLAKYGFTAKGVQEIEDAYTNKSPMAGPFVRKMTYKK